MFDYPPVNMWMGPCACPAAAPLKVSSFLLFTVSATTSQVLICLLLTRTTGLVQGTAAAEYRANCILQVVPRRPDEPHEFDTVVSLPSRVNDVKRPSCGRSYARTNFP